MDTTSAATLLPDISINRVNDAYYPYTGKIEDGAKVIYLPKS